MNERTFNYAHNDTTLPERSSRTADFNTLSVSERVAALRRDAREREVPVADDETLNFLLTLARAKQPESILEVGCAEGVTSLALADICPGAHITAIERDESFCRAAQVNLTAYASRFTLLSGEAADMLQTLVGESYDFIFLDCAKVQYIKLLPQLKRLLRTGGVLIADDVLLYGWVNGERETPKKRRMLVEHVREYLAALRADDELSTAVLDVGNGLAMSVKK